MLEILSRSFGSILSYKAIGKITKENYAALTTAVEALVQQESSICLLLDLEVFEGEKAKAWGADLKFGRDFRKKSEKLAIIGDNRWQKWIASIADPFYASEAKFFPTTDREVAWEWAGM